MQFKGITTWVIRHVRIIFQLEMKMMQLIQINIINLNLSKNIQNIKILKNNNSLVLKIQVFIQININKIYRSK